MPWISSLNLGATLEVTSSGEIMFTFPPDWRNILQERSYATKLKATFEKYRPYLISGFRASFGVALLASIAFIYIAAMSMMMGASEGDTDGDRKESSSNHSNDKKQFILHDGALDRRMLYEMMDLAMNLNRLSDPSSIQSSFPTLGCFYSYIFGDENPNKGLTLDLLNT